MQILAGTVLSTWTNAPFKGDSSAGADDEALSTADFTGPIRGLGFWRTTTEKHFTAACDSAAYRSSQATPFLPHPITWHTTSSKNNLFLFQLLSFAIV